MGVAEQPVAADGRLRRPPLNRSVIRTRAMWKPKEVGEVVAERRLVQRRRGGRSRTVRVRIGRPVRAANPRGEPWWCPVEIVGLRRSSQLITTAGGDSMQAMILALRAVENRLQLEGRRAGGAIEWLGEAERPIFAHTFLLEMYERAVHNLVDGLRVALGLAERASASPSTVRAKLHKLAESRGFTRARTARAKSERRLTRR